MVLLHLGYYRNERAPEKFKHLNNIFNLYESDSEIEENDENNQ